MTDTPLLRTDEQTIEDLGIFGKHKGLGIYDLYNRLHTRGGETILEHTFRHPLADKEAINGRSRIISGLAEVRLAFPYAASLLDTAEKYMLHSEEGEKAKSGTVALGEKEIQQGVQSVIEIIRLTRAFVDRPDIKGINAYAPEREAMAALLADPALEPALKETAKTKMSYAAVTAYDALFRISERRKIKALMEHIYRLDVYMSVAQTAVERRFIFPTALDKGSCTLRLEGVYHPALRQPVGNDMAMDAVQHIIFLTGANMAGKSTFLRALSTALYLAHMGFPVAAASMEFSVMDGLYTTVNLPDNLGIGASHFYVEVLRVKKMATELSTGKSFFILFDELFRGTNVKDAQEATVAVIKGFASRRNSLFIVSSHIVEAGEELRENSHIGFQYLPTRMNGHVPEYTYKLEQGITDDRHGMIIIRNEGILDVLREGRKKGAGNTPAGPGIKK